MNILIIVQEIGNSAAGLVTENLLKGWFDSDNNVRVICKKNNNQSFSKSEIIIVDEMIYPRTAIWKILMILTTKEWTVRGWVKKAIATYEKVFLDFKPQVILAMSSAANYAPFELGYRISKKHHIPLALHAFDPIPSTIGWGENKYYRRAMASCVNPFYNHSTWISATNQSMLNYQLNTVGIRGNKVTFVIENPSDKIDYNLNETTKNFNFIYLGNLYNKRNPQNLISAFSEYCVKNQSAHLFFIGKVSPNLTINIPDSVKNNIHFEGWTDNPQKYIEQASVLIDIDADLENDVFISSKLTNYLGVNRLILCITPPNSPASQFLDKINDSVLVCNSEKFLILKALKECESISISTLNYRDRKEVRNRLEVDTIIKKWTSYLNGK